MEKFNNIHVKVHTKSNFKNLNGKLLKVVQFLGSIVFVEYYDEEFGCNKTCDFNLREVFEIRNVEA